MTPETPAPLELTAEQFHKLFPFVATARAETLRPLLNDAMVEFDIAAAPLRVAAFVAQLGHESAGLRYFQEIASGAAYEGRTDLGNTQPGDGKRFKGRGPIQLTGRANYARASNALGLDLVAQPELAAEDHVGFRIAGWFWCFGPHGKDLNDLADRRKFEAITRAINGGSNGAADRNRRYAEALRVLGLSLLPRGV